MRLLLVIITTFCISNAFSQQKVTFNLKVLDNETKTVLNSYEAVYFSVSQKIENTVHPTKNGESKIVLPYKNEKYYLTINIPGYRKNMKSILLSKYEPGEIVNITFYMSR